MNEWKQGIEMEGQNRNLAKRVGKGKNFQLAVVFVCECGWAKKWLKIFSFWFWRSATELKTPNDGFGKRWFEILKYYWHDPVN